MSNYIIFCNGIHEINYGFQRKNMYGISVKKEVT